MFEIITGVIGGFRRLTMTGLSRIAAKCQALLQSLRQPYRPERHYMRGPGPKWHEKHGDAA